MKLESLHIKNYKLFKDLEIPKLGQVNLITGKNNTGKTILLEALRIWASEGDASVINNIIWKRGGWDEGSQQRTYETIVNSEFFQDEMEIKIHINDLNVEEWNKTELKYLRATKGYPPLKEDNTISTGEIRALPKYPEEVNAISNKIGNKEYPQDVAIFVSSSIDFDNKKLWANIDLTDKKDIVIQILQIIDPDIIDLGIIDNTARVRTKNSKTPVPLKNFGEGLNRLLIIAMALVSAEDNLLLIDEIDTGLHYSVLENLWEIIFKYAGELNTQVFVTTHSGDCVEAYTSVANQERFAGLGNYFRLQWTRDNQRIVPVMYKQKDLEIAVEQDIETR